MSRSALPPRSRLPPARDPVAPTIHAAPVPKARPGRLRPAIWSIGIFGIVTSGALIGAFWKAEHQQQQQQQTELLQEETSTSPTTPTAQTASSLSTSTSDSTTSSSSASALTLAQVQHEVSYTNAIDRLQGVRAGLVLKKQALEDKLMTFREEQNKKQDEERIRKEVAMKR